MKLELERAIERGIDWLDREQNVDGSFSCLVSTAFDDYRQATVVPAIVPTNIVLSSLIKLQETEKVRRIKQKAAHFLHAEKNDYWSINYWFRRSDWYIREPYPDDLDDTFCALAALYEYDPKPFDGEAMAKITTMLMSAEKQEGGPYDMWLVPPEGRKTWNDTDLVVNSNVAYFLHLHGISLPKLTEFIEQSIDAGRFEFPYNTRYPAVYFISRFYRGRKTQQLIDLLLKGQEASGAWENPLRTALAVSALFNLSGGQHLPSIEHGIVYLKATQREDGGWPAASFFFQMKTPAKTLYAGSDSTTTALCLEALNKYLTLCEADASVSLAQVAMPVSASEQIVGCIVAMVRERFVSCGPELRSKAEALLVEITSLDTQHQIPLLPWMFRKALGKYGERIDDALTIRLGAANVFGWMAYTAYDDFLDEEGDPTALSPANVCLRASVQIFSELFPDQVGFSKLTQQMFDLIDSANSWELAHARQTAGVLPDYQDLHFLAQRSLGHALGPIAMLFALGYTEQTPEVQGIRRFFEYYLIARQLNDDAHDWLEDLARGQVNVVATWVAEHAGLDLAGLLAAPKERLQKTFWETTVVRVCAEIDRQIVFAKEQLDALDVLTSRAELLACLRPIERSVQNAQTERKASLQFLKTFQAKRVTD